MTPPFEQPCPPEGHVVCPPGTYEELICEPGGPEGEWMEGGGGISSCPAPEICGEPPPVPAEECFPVCLPIEECGPGFHEEWICGDGPSPPDPEDPPGEWEGEGEPPCSEPGGCEPPPLPAEECFPICLPNEEICPPGTFPTVECNGFDECWETCHPFEAPCPPELIVVVECDENGCYEICVPPEGEPPPEPPEGEPSPEPR